MNTIGSSDGARRSRLQREIKEHILREFLPGAGASELDEHTPLITGGILDSISTVMLVQFLEDRFHIEMGAHEVHVDCLDTIERIAATVEAKRA